MQEFVFGTDKSTSLELIDNKATRAELYFPIQKYQDLLIELHQSSQNGYRFALLIGPMSSGKSTLLKQLETEGRSPCFIVQGHSRFNLHQVLSNYAVNIEAIDHSSEAILANIVQEIPNFHLLIDDADSLPIDTLQSILLVFQQQIGSCCLILAGELGLETRIDNLKERMEKLDISTFRIAPLSFKETKHYLEAYHQGMMHRQKRLSHKDIMRIFNLSEGYIGRINRVAMQSSFGTKYDKQKCDKLKRKKPRRTSFVDILLSIGIVFLLAIVTMRVSVLVMQNKAHHLHPRAIVQPMPSKPAPIVEPSIITPIPVEIEDASYITSIENVPGEIKTVSMEPESITPSLTLPPKPAVVHVKKKNIISHPAAPKKRPSNYTIQLMASKDLKTLKTWIQHSPFVAKLKLLSSIRGGEKWYVIAYGQFTTDAEAKQALHHLPASVKDQGAWVRSMKSLNTS